MGFTAASYEISNKLVATPSAVLVDGGSQPHHFEPLGEMSYLPDDGYICNGVQLFVLNFQQIKSLQPQDCLDEIQLHKVKYLRITVKKPLVTFLEGQYSPLNGKPYNNLGCYLAFLSVTGDDA